MNMFTFTANTGDSINVRLGTTGFYGMLQLYGPNGALLATATDSVDDLIAYKATNSGTFTALVSSSDDGDLYSGTYTLYLAQMPEPFIVPAGAQGGPMTNGGNYAGTNNLGSLAMFSFSANTGDNINVRLGTTGFFGKLQLYGPNGALLATATDSQDDPIAYTATNSGTFTALVSSSNDGDLYSGTYTLYLAQFPEPFIVPADTQGGPMTNGGNYAGTNKLGGLAMWSFSANTGDSINVRLGTTGFDGKLQLYGPNGALLATATDSVDDLIAYKATNSGTFTALVSSSDVGDLYTGTYTLYLAQMPEPFIVPAGAQGGPMTNGGNYPGTNKLGGLAMFSFSANTGDSINVRLGTTGFEGMLQLYGPNGALLAMATDSYDDPIAYKATNSGTFTALVSSSDVGDLYTGTYTLYLAQMPEPFIVPAGAQGGPMTNGGNYPGTNNLGSLAMFSFSANTGDSINVRLGTTSFYGMLQLYGPNGALLATATDSVDDLIAYKATNSGTFTALVSSSNDGDLYTGTYTLYLAQMPEPFIVPAGAQGGPMTNGGSYAGTNNLGSLAMFSFSANTGDSINVRLGTTSFYGMLQLYGPNGALLATATDSVDDLIAYKATNSGTFTALVSSSNDGDLYTGTYTLYLAQFPEPYIVPPGESGGPMTGAGQYTGTINRGEENMFSFTACQNDLISLQLNTTNFYGMLQLYGTNGALLSSATDNTHDVIAYKATNCGTFTVLVSSSDDGDLYAGTYGLTANELINELKVCPPIISGSSLTVDGVGGAAGAGFVLYSTTNVATPFTNWKPIFTNQFNPSGVFNYNTVYNPALPHEYFLFVEH